MHASGDSRRERREAGRRKSRAETLAGALRPAVPPAREARTDGRRRPSFAPDEKRRQALELFEVGIGYMRAARVLDLPTNTLREWSVAWRAGRFRTQLPERLYRYPREMRVRVIRMRLTGSTWKAISETTGVPVSTCHKWFDEHTRKPGRKQQVLVVQENGTLKT